MAARLILLNGPPASGKSTLAARFVASRPLALNLDIDVVRGLLGRWKDHASEAGLLARRIAIAMAHTSLQAGHDVIVPQFVARPEFLGELEQLANDVGASFVEVVLAASRDDMHRWWAMRSAAPAGTPHHDARALVDRLGGAPALDRMYDDFVELLRWRPGTRTIVARAGDPTTTLHDLERVITEASE